MKKKVKADPIFGVDALHELGQKAKAVTKPFQKVRANRYRSFKKSRTYHEYMEYIHGEPDE